MERAPREKGNGGQAASRCIAQCRSVSGRRRNEILSGIDNSPLMVAQRRKLHGMFGAAAQLQEEGGARQDSHAPLQKKPFQGEFATRQLEGIEEEKPFQRSIDIVQRVSMSSWVPSLIAPIQRMSRMAVHPLHVSGAIIQKVKEKLGNPSEFEVDKSDLNKGTATSEGTRTYVNEGTTTKPSKINWEYKIPTAGLSDSGTADNPVSIKSGGKWDAGHLLGRQNGGKGDINAWVFPQNPQINRGNYDDADNPTYVAWRAVENTFHGLVDTHGKGTWKITLA